MTRSTIDIDIERHKTKNHVPTRLPTGTGTTVYARNCMQHGACVGVANSYVMYMHNMPRDSPSRRRRKPCSRTMLGMRGRIREACEDTPCDNTHLRSGGPPPSAYMS